MHFLLVALLLLLSNNPALAQTSETGAGAGPASAAASVVIDGPAPSDQPNVMVRDASFKSTEILQFLTRAQKKAENQQQLEHLYAVDSLRAREKFDAALLKLISPKMK